MHARLISIALGVGALAGCGSEATLDPNAHKDDGTLFDPGLQDSGNGVCAEIEVTFKQRTPYVMLLVDQSGSMKKDFAGGSRWGVLHQALLDPQKGIVSLIHDELNLGFTLYSSKDGYAGGKCPMLSSIPSKLDNYQAIKQLYDSVSPIEDTPTGESIDAVTEGFMQMVVSDPHDPKAIVLATDGEPDTCEVPDPENGQDKTLAAAQNAFAKGVQTYIISVGDEVGAPHLQDMANAGIGLPVDGQQKAPYWVALDHAALYDAFATIINGVRECIFTLDGQVVAGFEDQGKVTIDGKPVAKDDENGWKLNGLKQVQLLGEACALIQEGDHKVDIEFPCGGYAPPIL
jgi:hypothetical protein